ncbi:MAG: hypothetical protein ACI3XY_00275 [Butyricicoccaceae bacterium]
MILYHITTMYQLLYVICHRLTIHPDEECCLFVTEYLQPKIQLCTLAERMTENGWFSFVKIIPEARFKLSRGRALDENSSESQIDQVVENICNTFERWLDFDLRSCKQRYVGSDQWSLGVYLLHNRIPYVYIEDASGMLSQQERYLKITKKINLTNYVICNRLNGAGRSRMVTGFLCDLKNQREGFDEPRAVDFAVYEAVSGMNGEMRGSLLDFYGVRPIRMRTDRSNCLFLTQYLTTLAVSELEIQEQITTLLADYIADGCRILVKPHPRDKWLDYHRVLPGCEIIPREINAELLPFSFDAPPDLALTISSTSIGGLRSFVEEIYEFGTDIESGYEQLHLYYAFARVLEHIGFDGSITYHGVDSVPARSFLRVCGVSEGMGPQRLLADCGVCFEDGREDYDLGVFFDTAHYADCVTAEILREAVEIRIRLIPDQDALARPLFHRIYVYCRNRMQREALCTLSISRRLQYTKADLRIIAQPMEESTAVRLAEKYTQRKRRYFYEIQNRCIRSREAE